MHNRARMIVASFLTKDLYIDWREGASHFMALLVDGDVANNQLNWQWTAGTGTDSNPNRIFNPTVQSKRFDPDGAYIRRYVPELRDVTSPDIHEPDAETPGSCRLPARHRGPPRSDRGLPRAARSAARLNSLHGPDRAEKGPWAYPRPDRARSRRAEEEATMTVTDDAASHWGEIDGVSIDFPMVVADMRQATLTYSVPIGPAGALLPGDAFEVMEVSQGRAMFIVALVDYISNPWGDYDEVNLGLLAHPVGQPERAGAFVYRMPVDQEFTMKAGNAVLGLPKTVEELSISCTGSIGDGRCTSDCAPAGRRPCR